MFDVLSSRLVAVLVLHYVFITQFLTSVGTVPPGLHPNNRSHIKSVFNYKSLLKYIILSSSVLLVMCGAVVSCAPSGSRKA